MGKSERSPEYRLEARHGGHTCPATAVMDAKLLSTMVENWNMTSPPNAEMFRPVR